MIEQIRAVNADAALRFARPTLADGEAALYLGLIDQVPRLFGQRA